ncbi:MAG TPA: hypothetical protein VF624_18910 [Tepidisphaeraceae bacterium]|jgi:hypothetical protein
MDDQPPQLLIFVRDLMFSSKVVATARAEGVSFKVVRDISRLQDQSAGRLVVDLNADGMLDAAIAWKARHNGRVIGFASHTAAELLALAKAGGIDQVMTNGAFTIRLPEIVREAAATGE